jgi:hypothetical protein
LQAGPAAYPYRSAKRVRPMAIADQARELLAQHGAVRPQPATEWAGLFSLPPVVAQFYQEVGPADVDVESYGNPFFLPSLGRLWQFQAGYRWNGLTGDRMADWLDDWLVVASEGSNPFILSRSSGRVLHDEVGRGVWKPAELFPDLNTMAASLGQLGALVVEAGDGSPTTTVSSAPSGIGRRSPGLNGCSVLQQPQSAC